MERLTLDDFEAVADAYDRSVAASADLDPFCTSSDWVVPSARGLMPGREAWIRRDGERFVAMMRTQVAGDAWLEPLEAMWGLACPLVGSDVTGVAETLSRALGDDGGDVAVVLCGLSPGSARLRAVVRVLARRYRLGLGHPTRRHIADLTGGVDAWRRRRSSSFRRSLRKAEQRAARAGVTFATVEVASADADRVWARIAAVDARTWKGQAGLGVGSGAMAEFYRLMLRRLAARGAGRVMFARLDEQDLAYILGGVRGDLYRGLQFGFAEEARPWSLGNLLQLRQIEALCDEGIGAYDLGAEVAYKARWADRVSQTASLIAQPR